MLLNDQRTGGTRTSADDMRYSRFNILLVNFITVSQAF